MSKKQLITAVLALAMCLSVAHAGPLGLSGNVLWLDASDGATISGGGSVSQWNDKSGLNNHFTQGDVNRQPLTGATSQNGLNVLTFDDTGAQDFLTAPAVLAANDDNYTYYSVFRPTKNAVMSVYEQGAGGNGRRSAVLLVNPAYGFNGQNNDAHGLVPYAPNQWRVSDMEIDNGGGPNVSIVDNDVPYSGTTGGGGPAGLNIGTDGTKIGKKQTANAEYFDGNIAEIIVYDRVLSVPERQSVRDYLDAKWALNDQAPPVPALVGLWRFDDPNPANVGKDSSSQGNDLTAYNQAAQTTQGKYAGALNLGGSDDWLGIAADNGGDNPGAPTNIPVGGSSYTIAAWVKPSPGVAGNAGIVGWGNYGSGNQVNAFRLNSTDGLHNYWWGNDLGNDDVLPGSEQFTDGTWCHVAVTYDAAAAGDDHKIFVNGVQVAQRNSNNAINVQPQNFRIGETNGLNEDWLGLLDDVAVFNVALTPTQIQTIATGDFTVFGGGGAPPPPPPPIDFNFDDGSGNPDLNGWTIIAQSNGNTDVPYLQVAASEAGRMPTAPCLTTAWDISGPGGGFEGDHAHDMLVARSPTFQITAAGLITWDSVGGNPGDAVSPGTGTGAYPYGAMGVSLVRASDGFRVMSVETTQQGGLTGYSFDITPYLNDGNNYYLEVVDNLRPNQNTGWGYVEWDTFSIPQAAPTQGDIPEPATLFLAGLALTGLGGYVRRRRRATA